MARRRHNLLLSSIFLLTVTVLTLGFANNQWRIADDGWFKNFQLDSESLVVGRLAKSQQDGIFSAGGLTGRSAKPIGTNDIAASQYLIYLNNLPVYEFDIYNSQIGFQAMFFGFLGRLSTFTNYENLIAFKTLTALLTALALAIIVVWFTDQFGLIVGIFGLITTLLSQWLVVFGRNLWWVIWVFYLPMLVSIGILDYESKTKKYSNMVSAVLISFAVFIKCLFNGYEYITTTLIMLITPYIYYGVYNKWPLRKLSSRILVISIGGITATLTSMIILVYQISSVEGRFIYGLEHILYSFGKRTYGSPEAYPAIYKSSLEASTFNVLASYLNGVWLNLNDFITVNSFVLSRFIFRLSFAHLIFLYLLITVLGIFVLRKYTGNIDDDQNKLRGLIGATWFSLLAPLSWFIIFKSHSFIHVSMNQIVWHMPFTLYGFALMGFVTKLLILVCSRRKVSPRNPVVSTH